MIRPSHRDEVLWSPSLYILEPQYLQLGRVSVGTPWLARLPSLSASFFICRSKLSMANSSQGSGGAVLVSHCLIALRLSPRREASSPCVHLAFSLKCVSSSLTLMMQLIHHHPATASQDCHVSSLLNARVHFVHHPTLPSEPTGNRSVRSRVSQEARIPHSLLTCRVRVRFGRSPPALRQVNAAAPSIFPAVRMNQKQIFLGSPILGLPPLQNQKLTCCN